ncbi:MAG: DUF4886 domain-containing protein [Ruminococcaceae bacterium]|nr:DUF4886 domain-containing protein [Oscillospiraceae bacterium]
MNILSIGNSFSEDAQRYIHDIARNAGVTLNTYNLYIGGCPLEWHFRYMLSEEKKYTLCVNGHNTYFFTSIKEALLSCAWDVVTFQQVSHFSVDYETYQPYLNELVCYVKKHCPKAKVAIHQTWAYEEGSDRLIKELKYQTRKDMFEDIKKAYIDAARDINADIIIPSGELMEALSESGIKVHRDTFHASLGVARYAIGLLWYAVLTGKSIKGDSFNLLDEKVTDEERKIVLKCVEDTVKSLV